MKDQIPSPHLSSPSTGLHARVFMGDWLVASLFHLMDCRFLFQHDLTHTCIRPHLWSSIPLEYADSLGYHQPVPQAVREANTLKQNV